MIRVWCRSCKIYVCAVLIFGARSLTWDACEHQELARGTHPEWKNCCWFMADSLQPNTDVGSADIRGWGCRVVQRDPALATASSGCSAGWAGIMWSFPSLGMLSFSHLIPFVSVTTQTKVLQQVIAYTFKEMESTTFANFTCFVFVFFPRLSMMSGSLHFTIWCTPLSQC